MSDIPPFATAEIDVTVTSFVDIINTPVPPGIGRTCGVTLAMAQHNPNPNVSIKDGIIRVKNMRMPQTLQFNLLSGSPVPDTYIALGIAFQQKAPKPTADPVGQKNFPNADFVFTKPTAVRVRDQFDRSVADGKAVTYEAFLMIQRVSDGAIGIIDPDCQNDPE